LTKNNNKPDLICAGPENNNIVKDACKVRYQCELI
jgi:hypothetical protein